MRLHNRMKTKIPQVVGDECCITTEPIRAVLNRSHYTASSPDAIQYEDTGNILENNMKDLANEFKASIQMTRSEKNGYPVTFCCCQNQRPFQDQCLQDHNSEDTSKKLEMIFARDLISRHIFSLTLGGYWCNKETWLNAAAVDLVSDGTLLYTSSFSFAYC